jgi:small nuclear ribonucleoprotein (snRNP)-like protein
MDALSKVKEILGQTITCTLQDERKISGTLVSLDRECNIILHDVMEIRYVHANMYNPKWHKRNPNNYEMLVEGEDILTIRRSLSQALVPGDKIVKVELIMKEKI